MKWISGRRGSGSDERGGHDFHYRLQIERRHGGWVDPVHRGSGALVDGCHGVVRASEEELAAVAVQIMERSGGSWRNCRVVFVSGQRGTGEVLRDEDVFGVVAQKESVFVPGPAHPGFVPSDQPPFEPQPQPQPRTLDGAPRQHHGLADRQIVECGSCRTDITVRLAERGAVLVPAPENLRGTALMCGLCCRLLCVDCLVPVVDLPFDPRYSTCDRCGGVVGPVPEAAAQAAGTDTPPLPSRTFADHSATEVIDCVVACRRTGLRADRTVQYVLDELRREHGDPAHPFAASLERLAYGTAGPALYQESMESDEVAIVDAILRRLADALRN
ncbi:hypothetical protein GQF42_41095 [Streptomyces broussonetiae]|uniref:Uncharacterized protein n=1 Tax=Streptomyces broussonetiae TaxID=2686304 RepID=A0A6I6NKX0_9ACTN|nr:hypothetical protein [Streptomyces broussonetiae]QHA08806.1 hypothetical protein GQF42_41095 [Streptomyces broussonetiae]